MLRVERGRRRRETLKYWEMSNIRVMMNFTGLLSIIISVSFIVSICMSHLTSNHCLRLINIARPEESQARAEGEASDSKKKFTWLRKLLLKFRRKQRAWWVLILNSIRSWRDKTLTLWRDTVVNRHQKLENLHFYGYYNFSYTQAGVTERLGRLNLWMEIQDYYKWCLHAIYCNVEDVRIQLGFRRVAFQVFYGEAMSLSDIASLFINFLKILY